MHFRTIDLSLEHAQRQIRWVRPFTSQQTDNKGLTNAC